MAETEARALLLQISATTELLRSNLSQAEQAVAKATTEMQHHLDDQDKKFEHFGKGLEKLEGPLERIKTLAEGGIAALIGENILEKGKEILEFAGHLKLTADQLGVTTDFLQKFNFAAVETGSSAEEADRGLQFFSRSVGRAADGNKQFVQTFDQLGVKVRDSSGNVRAVQAVFLETADAISKLASPAERSAATMALFGRSAAPLIPLLMEGREGFTTLAQAADQLGIVLSPEMIEHSEQVNRKLAALKMVVDAQMAEAIAKNAGSIETLASAFVSLAGGIAKFLGSNPTLALAMIGAAGGSRFGPYGAAAGFAIGGFGQMYNQHQQDEANNDIPFRREQQEKADAEYRRQYIQNGGRVAPTYLAEVQRQSALMQRALKAQSGSHEAGTLGSTGAGATNDDPSAAIAAEEKKIAGLTAERSKLSGSALTALNEQIKQHQRTLTFLKAGVSSDEASSLAGKQAALERRGEAAARRNAHKAEEERLKKLQEEIAYQGELRAADEALAKAKLALADTADGQLAVELEILRDAETTREEQLKLQVLAHKRTQAEADALLAKYREAEADNEILAERKKQSRILQEQVAKESLELQGKLDALGIEEQLARTAKDRLKIELEILSLQEKLAKQAQQEILDDPTKTAAEKQLAQTRKDQIDQQHAGNVQLVTDRNLGPWGEFLHQLPKSADEVNEAFERTAAEGVRDFNDGIKDSILHSKSLGDVWDNITDRILGDLIDIAEKQAESSIFGGNNSGGSGGSGGGGLGGLFNKLGGFLGSLFGGGGNLAGSSSFSIPGLDIPGVSLGDMPAFDLPSLPAFAGGGDPPPGMPSLVGEEGPELFVPRTPGTIIPNGALARGFGPQVIELHVLEHPSFASTVKAVSTDAAVHVTTRTVQDNQRAAMQEIP